MPRRKLRTREVLKPGRRERLMRRVVYEEKVGKMFSSRRSRWRKGHEAAEHDGG